MANQVNVAAQSAPRRVAPSPLRRVGIAEHEHEILKRPGDDMYAEHVLAAGRARPSVVISTSPAGN